MEAYYIVLPLIITLPVVGYLFLKHRKSERLKSLYFLLLENSNEAICVTDAERHIEYVNPAFSAITGYPKDEVIGRDPNMMKSGRHSEGFYQEMWRMLAEEGEWRGEIWDRKKDGEIFPKWLSIRAVKDRRKRVLKYMGIFPDITFIKENEEYLEHLTHYDGLTGLPNRLLLRERLKEEIRAAENGKYKIAVVYIDVDKFKKVNNALGYAAGDELLAEMGRRLSRAVHADDIVARMGGDEFAVVLRHVLNDEAAVTTAQKILDSVSGTFVLKTTYDVTITVSMGLTLNPLCEQGVNSILRDADIAMSMAKESGGNQFRFYAPEMKESSFDYLSTEANLRHAFENDEFILYYQPIGDLLTGKIRGMEALIRRKEPYFIAAPEDFIAVAEKSGLILPLCEWTLKKACEQAAQWRREGMPPLRVSVNVTAAQFHQKILFRTVEKVLLETGLEPQYLELELTEKVIVHDSETSIRTMEELKSLGVHLSIDDFGTGYSSLSYLKKFPVDKLKIDISFVRDLPSDADSASIARAIIALAHNLNLIVCAEGVENRMQYEFLKEHGCDMIQGYYLSIPLPAESFKRLITARKEQQS